MPSLPLNIVLYWPDTKAGLAVEDRDLIAEADDADGAILAVLAVLEVLYPPSIAWGQRILPLMN